MKDAIKSGNSDTIPIAMTSGIVPVEINATRLTYIQRLKIIKPDVTDLNKACRVMVYNETHGMLVVSQPSSFQLAPGDVLSIILLT